MRSSRSSTSTSGTDRRSPSRTSRSTSLRARSSAFSGQTGRGRHDGRVDPGASTAGRRARPRPWPRSCAGRVGPASADRLAAAGVGAAGPAQGVGGRGSVRLAVSRRGRLGRVARAVEPGGGGEGRLCEPLGRPAPAALRRSRPRQRSRGRLPRRDDPGSRPRRASRDLGPHPRDPGARHHCGARDPLQWTKPRSSAIGSRFSIAAAW
jgi:hypothetical protein